MSKVPFKIRYLKGQPWEWGRWPSHRYWLFDLGPFRIIYEYRLEPR